MTDTIATAEPGVRDWEPELQRMIKREIKRVIANPADIERYQVEFYNLAKSIKGAKEKAKGSSGLSNFEQLVELGQERSQRMSAVQLVGAVGGHEHQRLGPQVAHEEREQVARGAVGPVQVFQDEHQRLLAWEEEMLAKIEVPYRVIDTAAGDLGSSAARKFDCEAWFPSQETYRELSSTSNCTTFQARRLNTRYRDTDGKPQTAATLNGTLATTRWLVAILENHQQPDGSVRVPDALIPFVGTEVLEP